MKIRVTPRFMRSIKKLHPHEKLSLDDAVKAIAADPKVGESKKGDLAGVRVYKYKHQQQLYLVAYSVDAANEQVVLMAHGVHENFYRDLKQG